MSESLTNYLSACAKGASAKSVRVQPYSDIPAKQRAYSFKGSYMTSILRKYIFGDETTESIVKDPFELKEKDIEAIVLERFEPYIGQSINELKERFGIKKDSYQTNYLIASAILDLQGQYGDASSFKNVDEFEKASIELKTIKFNDGINVILDQYDFELGDRLPYSMEQAIKQSDYVLIICTPTYKEKADSRTSGVGYEGNIISGELYSKGNERKFVPIIRKGDFQISMPDFLLGKMGVALTDENDYEENYNNLLASLYGAKSKPAIGETPSKFRKSEKSLPKSNNDKEIEIVGIITNEVTLPKNDGLRGSALYKIPFRLNRAPDLIWKKLFINSWDRPPRFTGMHRPGIASINSDKIILNGTTIDEVKDYHKDTLILCVKETNKKYKRLKDLERNREKQQQSFTDEHYNHIRDMSDQIKF